MSSAPKPLLPWLTYTDYLTKRLHDRSGDTHLRVLSERWQDATLWDQQILGLSTEHVLHRDILMLAKEQPCWYARTILPRATFEDDLELFARLKHEPLGQLIFEGKNIQRVDLRHYAINAESPEYAFLPQEQQRTADVFWMRLATFQLNTEKKSLFYLLEILLPGLEIYCE